MSIALINAAWRLPMPASRKLVLLAMCDWSNDEGTSCHPSIKSVAIRASMSQRQVQRVLHGLIEDGWMTIVGNANGGAPGQTRQYQLNVDAIKTGDTYVRGDKLSGVTSEAETGDIQGTRRVTSRVETGDTHVTQTTIDPSIEPKSNLKPTREQVALPEWLDRQAWADWLDHRKKLRKPMTPRAMELTLEKLAGMRRKGHDPTWLINHAIENGWQGIYLPRHEPQEKPANASPNRSTGRKLSAVEQVEQAIRERRERDGPESGAAIRIGYG